MQLTVFTDYGLRTLMFLAARTGEMCNVKDIANHYGISRNHLVKVVHHLSQAGYIVSAKGRGGGIRLAEGTAELRLGDIVLALEPNMNLVECFDRKTNTCKITGTCACSESRFSTGAGRVHNPAGTLHKSWGHKSAGQPNAGIGH